MKISFICIGKTNFPFIREGIELYRNRVNRYTDFEITEIPDKKAGGNDVASIRKKEGEQLISKISASAYLVLLDERGKQLSSEELSGFIEAKVRLPVKHLIFMIGGAYGFSDTVYKRANETLSLSKLTFSHQLVRLIFMEQLYRAFTIIKGEPYHHS